MHAVEPGARRAPSWLTALVLAGLPWLAQPASAASPAASPAAARPHPAAAPTPSDAATATALAQLGLALLRQEASNGTQVEGHVMVSPLSLAMALAQVHAGAAGGTATELARLLGSIRQGQRVFTRALPALHHRLTASEAVTQANRLWVDEALAGALQPGYTGPLAQRWGSDVGTLRFTQGDAARTTLNQWVAQHTAQRIPELMPPGSLAPSARLVLTNALHFKSAWQQPFEAANTQPRPFTRDDGSTVPTPMLQDERTVQVGTVGAGATVATLPFAGQQYHLLLAMPPAGQTLSQFTHTLRGADLVRWPAQLQPASCSVAVPRLNLAPTPHSLKASLQALGVKRAFDERADLRPMLGAAAKGLHLENVFQATSLTLDETGGEASAATAVVIGVKSARLPAPACAVFNRPFLFALVHTASGTPLFMGQLRNPAPAR